MAICDEQRGLTARAKVAYESEYEVAMCVQYMGQLLAFCLASKGGVKSSTMCDPVSCPTRYGSTEKVKSPSKLISTYGVPTSASTGYAALTSPHAKEGCPPGTNKSSLRTYGSCFDTRHQRHVQHLGATELLTALPVHHAGATELPLPRASMTRRPMTTRPPTAEG